MRSNPVFTWAMLVLLLLPALVAADNIDNQIDGGPPFRYSRPNRARYVAKTCRPCGQNECQVMGMQRFSEPRCEAFGGLGSPCRMWQEPENKTLSFPDKVLYCDDVYMQFCPCAQGLVCDEAECKRPRERQQRVRPNYRHPKRQRHQEQLEREDNDEGFDVSETDGRTSEPEMPIAFESGRLKKTQE